MNINDVKVDTLEEARVHIAVLTSQLAELQNRVALHDEELDMCYRTPLWKRIFFWIDGWPFRRTIPHTEQAWRPWHRWWRS